METHTPKPLWREMLGRILRQRRSDLRLTLSQVSERSGVSGQYLSEIERGLKDPSSEVIEAIAAVLGLGLPDILVLAALDVRGDDRMLLTAQAASAIAGSRSDRMSAQAQLSLAA